MNDRKEELISLYAERNIELLRENKKQRMQIEQLERDAETLKKVIALLMRDSRIVYRQEEINRLRSPKFYFEENIGGTPILRTDLKATRRTADKKALASVV